MRDPWVCAIGNVSLVAIAETTTLVPCHAEKFLHGFHLKMGHQYNSHNNDHQGDMPNMYPHKKLRKVQYIPRNIHTVFALLCFVVVIHWMIFPYPSGLLHWHCGNLTIAPVPAKQPWWIWINTSCEFIMNDCITTTKQSATKPCAYFLGYTVFTYYQ